MSGGFKRYNEIQKAVSAQLKAEGKSLKGSGKKFHEIASQAYHQTKSQPLKQAVNNMDIIVGNIFDTPTGLDVPQLTSDQLSTFNFYEAQDIIEGETMPANLFVNSFMFEGEVSALDLNYDDHLRSFYAFCNRSKGKTWQDSTDAPMLRFTEPQQIKKGHWVSDITTPEEVEDDYGFILGDEQAEVIPHKPEPEEEITPEAEPESRREKAKERAAERSLKIKELEIESRKLDIAASKQAQKTAKAQEKKLKEYNKAVNKLESLYDKGLITKAQFQKRFNQLDI